MRHGPARSRSGAGPELSPLAIVAALGCVGLAALVGIQVVRERAARLAFRATGFAVQGDAALTLQKMVEEIQDSLRIVYPPMPTPRPGDVEIGPVSAGGVGIINARGEPIMYYIDDAEQDPMTGKMKQRHLLRTNLADGSTRTLVTGVTAFAAILPPIRSGKPVARVNLQLAATDVAKGSKGKEETLVFATGVIVPAAMREVPEPW